MKVFYSQNKYYLNHCKTNGKSTKGIKFKNNLKGNYYDTSEILHFWDAV